MVMLKVNNLTVSVANSKLHAPGEEIGGSRVWSGRWCDQRMRFLRSWSIETTPMKMGALTRLKHWVMGRGHHWSFDVDLYSDKGLGPSTYSAAPTITTGTTKFSEPLTAFAYLGAAGATCTWALTLDGPDQSYSVSRWVWNGSDGGYGIWRHYFNSYDAKTASSVALLDGSTMPSISNFTISTSGGVVSYLQRARNNAHSSNAAIWVEDLVMAPYAMDTDMVAAIIASPLTLPFGACPHIMVTGDIIEEAGPVYAVARMKRRPYLQAQPAGDSWQDNMGTLAFEIHEV